ncbi:MAG TPA: Calx-beta domain-containing protein, partial [Verrucomicrobiae bacterium]|nr:Calx-beta domain-containing protein [Verrucomicrobiae bacterium]
MRVRLAGWLLILYCVAVAGFEARGDGGGTIVTGWGAPSGPQFDFPPGLTNVLAISAGYSHVIALMPNHTVRAWGFDNYGATDVPASLTNVTAIAAGTYHNLALTAKGTVVQWGQDTPKKLALKNIVAIAAGNDFSLALQKAGTVKAWGNNASGTTLPRRLKNVTAIAAGDSHALALKKDGTVVSWGSNGYGQTNVPAGLSNVVMIAAGYNSSVALDSRGVLWQWGEITQISPIPNPQPVGIAQIAVGLYHVAVRTTNGTLTDWSFSGAFLFPAGLTNVSTIAAGQSDTFAAINGPVLRGQLPLSTSVLSGSNVTFTTSADSASPFQYQWYHNNLPLPDGTNATLQLNAVHTNATGYYFVTVSNAFGSMQSALALLQVTALNVLSVPFSQPVITSQSATFGISVDSLLPVQYQWYLNDNPIPYGTNATLTITNAHYADQGYYNVCVSNEDRTTCLTVPIFLTVTPIWSIPPASVVKIPGSTNFLRFTIAMPEARPDSTQINYYTLDGGVDYLDVSGTLTFSPGVTNLFVDVPIIGNTNIGPKTFLLRTGPGVDRLGYFSGATGTGLILDPNYVPTLSMTSATVQEGDAPYTVTQSIQLSGPASQPVTVNFSTVDGSAYGGIDYAATNGQIVFPPPTTSEQFSLTILGNILKQP